MDIPESLQAAIRRFRSSLDDELYHVEHDTDMDGFAAGIIATVALRRMGYEAYPYPKERSRAFVPEQGAIFFTDIALNGEPVDVVNAANTQKKNVYAIDHHPWEQGVEKKLKAFVNPHLLSNIPEPSQWNAGFLAFLTFREHVMDYDWLAAISVYTDSCIRPWNQFLIDRYGYERVKKAGDMMTAYIATSQDLRDLDWIILDSLGSIDDVLNYKPFIVAQRKFESAVQKYLENPKAYSHVWDEKRKVAILETKERYNQINSVVSTRLSFLPEFRDWIIVVLGQEEDGTIKGSLRCQDWERRGVHLGKIASEIAESLGGRGGGHPMAAGMRIPAHRIERVVKKIEGAVARA